MKLNRKIIVSCLAGGIVIMLLWWGAAVIVELPIIPTPVKVFRKLVQIFTEFIAIHALYSLWRITGGLILAIIIGYPLGVLMGYYKHIDKLLAPIVYLTYPVPKIALLPILMLLAGVGELSKIIMIFLIVVFQIIIAVRDSIRSLPAETFYPLCSLGASWWQIFTNVIIPASLPKFMTAIRVAMATSVSVLFFTETFGTKYGMGYFIMDAWLRVNYLEMYAGIVVLSVIGLLLFIVIDGLEHYFCRWQ